MLGQLVTVVDTLKQGTHPRHVQQDPGPTFTLWASVILSWVVKNCQSSVVESQGALAVRLPQWVADSEDAEVKEGELASAENRQRQRCLWGGCKGKDGLTGRTSTSSWA